ncbi:MAG: flavodoxin family protein [Methanobacterium sp.]|jgi:multimeric flavodoxin WrbA|nr:flavodoxin family protein [Methanobacterium sp.]
MTKNLKNTTSTILGISGSPVENSNTDLLVKTIMEATGANQEFVKLSNIKVAPCMACKKCVYTNQCVQDDDFKWLSQKVLNADGLVIGSPVMYGNASAFTKAFVERLWSLRHVKLLTQGKVGATAVVGWSWTDDVSKWLNYIMMIGGMEVVGNVIGHGSPGCFTCGPGENCNHSVWNTTKKLELMMGRQFGMEKIYEGYMKELPDNNPMTNPSYKILKCISVKDQLEVMEKALDIGKAIGAKLKVDIKL